MRVATSTVENYGMFWMHSLGHAVAHLRWWYAEQHMAEALEWAKNWQGERDLAALDAFGASQGIKRLSFQERRSPMDGQ